MTHFDLGKSHKAICGFYRNQWNIIQSGGLVFMWKLSPPISPPVRCGILLQFAVWIKRKTADNDWLSAVFIVLLFVWVIRLGLEPKTPTLKVLCSTCWASESNLCCSHFLIASAKVVLSFESAKLFVIFFLKKWINRFLKAWYTLFKSLTNTWLSVNKRVTTLW